MAWSEEEFKATVARMMGVSPEQVKSEDLKLAGPEGVAEAFKGATGSLDDVEIPDPLAALPEGWAVQVSEEVAKARRTLRYANDNGFANSDMMARLAAARLLTLIGDPAAARAVAPAEFASTIRSDTDFRRSILEASSMLAMAASAFDAEVEEQREAFEAMIAKGGSGSIGRWQHQIGVTLGEEENVATLIRWLRENVGHVGSDYVLIHGAHSRAITVLLKDDRKAGLVALRWTSESYRVVKE